MNLTEPPKLSVIIPAFNEEKRLPATLDKLESYFSLVDYAGEVIVANDGSGDRTAQIVREREGGPARIQLSQDPVNLGKGAAVRRGMSQARGAYRLFFDADGSTPIEEIEKLWPAFDAGADICIGSRVLPKSNIVLRQPRHRELMGRIFNLMVATLVLRGIRDTQCGFKAFTARAAEVIFPRQRLNGFGFDVELLYIARIHDLTVREIPVTWVDSPSSRIRPWRDARRMFFDLIRIRRQARQGFYR